MHNLNLSQCKLNCRPGLYTCYLKPVPGNSSISCEFCQQQVVVVAKTGFSFNHKSLRRSSASFTMWKPCFITSFPKWDNKLWVTIPLIDARLESEFPSSPIGFFKGGLVWWNLPMNCEMLQDRDIFYQTFSHHWAACRWESKYWWRTNKTRTSRDVDTRVFHEYMFLMEKIGSTGSASIWGLLWRNPRIFDFDKF